jgi:hypothetical protein
VYELTGDDGGANDAGQMVNYKMTISHGSISEGTAFDIEITVSNPKLDPIASTVVSSRINSTFNVTLNTLTFNLASLPLAQTWVINFGVRIASTVIEQDALTTAPIIKWRRNPTDPALSSITGNEKHINADLADIAVTLTRVMDDATMPTASNVQVRCAEYTRFHLHTLARTK